MASTDHDPPHVVDNPGLHRYEIWVGEVLAGFAEYRERPGHLVFVHTETEPGWTGHGLATTLARAALDDVRSRGLGVVALCPFIAEFIANNPAYQDLLVTHH